MADAREVCDYCDCRDVAPIRELSEDHQTIGQLATRLGQALTAKGTGGPTGAEAAADGERSLRDLQDALRPHLELEEAGVFAQLSRRDGFTWYLGELMADHRAARNDLLGADPRVSGWQSRVLSGLDRLAEHISVEEYDLFPASRMVIDDRGWGEVIAVHKRLGRSGGGVAI